MVNIQIVSDIHLEFRGENFKNIIKPSAPILCLLGDVSACGNPNDFLLYQKFIQYISGKFKYIFHIPGNHEYYTAGNSNITINDTIPGIDSKIKKFLKEFKNIFYMNNDTIKLEINKKTYVFIGTTLWTGVRQQDKAYVSSMMNDYDNIYMPNRQPKNIPPNQMIVNWKSYRKYNIDDMTLYHKKAVRYIIKKVSELNKNEICIILTHHKPYRTRAITDLLSQAYETDLLGSVIKLPPNVKLIGYGHTHVKDDRIVSGARVVSNPKGYPSQHTMHDSAFIVSV